MTNIQYTIRNIPSAVDQVIRKRAQQTGKSFNQTVVDLLVQQTFGSEKVPPEDNFDWLFGVNTLDDSFDEAIAEMSKPDPRLWQ
jgi:plasmid stability protein